MRGRGGSVKREKKEKKEKGVDLEVQLFSNHLDLDLKTLKHLL